MDDVFEILSNRRRRYAIRYLTEIDEGPVRVRDLAERIAAWENDVTVADVTYRERKRVYTSLYQLHLEKMDRLGIVSYDRNGGTVARTAVTERLVRYLESSPDDGTAWNRTSFGLSILCAVFVAGAWAVPFGSGAGFVVAFGVASVFVLVTSVRAFGDR